MEQITYTQDDVTVIKVSYTEEIQRYAELKANKNIEIQRLKKQVQKLTQEIIELKTPKAHTKKTTK